MSETIFAELKSISKLMSESPDEGRNRLIRILDTPELTSGYEQILNSLLEKAGLFQYIVSRKDNSLREKLVLEFHRPFGLPDIVLHKIQGEAYRKLLDGKNLILSAPTSFGKSLLIDAAIASHKFNNIAVIVPTVALIEETRKRLNLRFGDDYKIITYTDQSLSENNLFILTQERFLELGNEVHIDFFVIDEFYKLSPSSKGDGRSFVLNDAFYHLIKRGAQFMMIGPNIQSVEVGTSQIAFEFMRTDFSTVAANVYFMGENGVPNNVIDVCNITKTSTLIFCKSSNSAYSVGKQLAESLPSCEVSNELQSMIDWLVSEYDPRWNFVKLLSKRIGVHHAGLPRSISQHVLRLFNSGAIDFLLCTNTIIEGVNTGAKNIIIFDNKIATKKFDYFTFNNIKGRAGRMFKHFVGNVYVNNPEPQQTLPIVEISALTQSENTPDTLLLRMDPSDLSEYSTEKLRYLHAQNILPVSIIRKNVDVSSTGQLSCAEILSNNIDNYYSDLFWTGLPNSHQIDVLSELIFDYLMNGKGDQVVYTKKHLANRIRSIQFSGSYDAFLKAEIANTYIESIDERIENTLKFIRNWCDHNLPKYVMAIDSIQKHVFSSAGKKPGDYVVFSSKIKSYFENYGVNILEEMGIPLQVSKKINLNISHEAGSDGVLNAILSIDESDRRLHSFEKRTIEIAKQSI